MDFFFIVNDLPMVPDVLLVLLAFISYVGFCSLWHDLVMHYEAT